jgi:hypothetical protein
MATPIGPSVFLILSPKPGGRGGPDGEVTDVGRVIGVIGGCGGGGVKSSD